MIRSIRLSLTLWYVSILVVTLCLFSGVLYCSVKANLVQDVDDLLASQADGVADTIFTFLEAQWKGKEAPPSQDLQKVVEEGRLPDLVNRWAEEAEELERMHPIRLIDREGRLLYTSRNFSQFALSVTRTALEQAKLNHTVYETFTLPDKRVRLITRPVVEGSQMLYLVQVVSSLRQVDASLGRLRLWLAWLVPLTLLITSAVGWFLATMALQPVDRMIHHAQRIRAEHLHERLDVPRTGDELERLAATFNDMLARLEQAFRRLRQFSAAASHELRTPLTVMKGELEVALRRPRTSEEYQNVLRTHLETLNEMSHIVEQLLTLARSEEGERAVEWRPVELGSLLQRVQDSWRAIYEKKGVNVKINAREPVWVRGERRLLERLVSNLLDNAIKHTPSRGRVTLELERRGHRACLTVQDTGPGISPAELPQIFDRFFTRSSNGPQSSIGLGLGLCRWIAEAHQGRIEVTSAPSQGSSFRVLLPTSMKNL